MPTVFRATLKMDQFMCKMKVTRLDDSADFYTLCFDNNGDYEPLTDFINLQQANLIQELINNSGYCIKLSDHATTREFSIGRHKDESFEVIKKTNDLTSALDFLNIKVDFFVEPPQMENGFDLF